MFDPTHDDDQPTDPAAALMREVGAQLREARLERGEDLEQVADSLRIKPAYLQSIEDGDLSVMPGRAYALGFLRSYADHLGYDGEDLIERIKSTVDDLTDRAHLHVRTPLPENRLPRTPVVVLSLALVGGIYAGWVYLDHSDEFAVETVAEVPDDLRRLAMDSSPSEPDGLIPGDRTMSADGRGGATGERLVREPGRPLGAETSPGMAADDSEPGDGARRTGVPGSSLGDPATRLEGVRSGATGPALAARTGRIEAGTGAAPAGTAGITSATREAVPESDTTVDPAGDRTVRDSPASDAPSRANDEAPSDAATSGDATIVPDAGAAGEPEPADAATPPPTAREVLAALEETDPSASRAEGGPQVYETVNADARVLLRATDQSWVRITSESGDYLRTHTMQAGDVFLVPNRADLSLWTGNAGGLEVIVDGTVLPALGPDGRVMRDVSLDPERLTARGDREE